MAVFSSCCNRGVTAMLPQTGRTGPVQLAAAGSSEPAVALAFCDSPAASVHEIDRSRSCSLVPKAGGESSPQEHKPAMGKRHSLDCKPQQASRGHALALSWHALAEPCLTPSYKVALVNIAEGYLECPLIFSMEGSASSEFW